MMTVADVENEAVGYLDEKQAYESVYNNISEMKSYMIGLAISQFLWPKHYAMYSFFNDKVARFIFSSLIIFSSLRIIA